MIKKVVIEKLVDFFNIELFISIFRKHKITHKIIIEKNLLLYLVVEIPISMSDIFIKKS